MMSEDIVVTPAQIRAARALLAWSQKDLAEAAQVGISTIADFEREARVPVRQNLFAMRRALESAGVRFISDGASEIAEGVNGVGVRLIS